MTNQKTRVPVEDAVQINLVRAIRSTASALNNLIEKCEFAAAALPPGSDGRLQAHHAKAAADVCRTNLKMTLKEIGRTSDGRFAPNDHND